MQNYYFSFKVEKQNIPFLSFMTPQSSHVEEHSPIHRVLALRVGVELGKGPAAILRNNILAVPVPWRHRARSREEGRKTRRRHSWHHSKITAKRSSSAEVQASQKASQTLPLYSFLSSKEVVSITHCPSLLELARGIWARTLI